MWSVGRYLGIREIQFQQSLSMIFNVIRAAESMSTVGVLCDGVCVSDPFLETHKHKLFIILFPPPKKIL
jgi:hypothetical protein